jgi:hypothetical protein
MKAYARRESGRFPYFKLAVWDARVFTWRDGKTAFDTLADAVRAAITPGRYRISEVGDDGRHDLEPFTV